jgi:hypothetical protein
LVAIVGEPDTRASALHGFQNMWLYAAGMATLSGLIAIRLKRPAAAEPVAKIAVITPRSEASVASAS